eukprot:TRINITY_DN5042_c0_g1_i1.p1 TRINITY_DN5042_c0_g1~~TRINITY_DN5042_c0_g1_i1.p1  ORF type:complete len:110 (+),score=21.71 TRINITY_DN5042_c0_g1_i1:67-396(+)
MSTEPVAHAEPAHDEHSAFSSSSSSSDDRNKQGGICGPDFMKNIYDPNGEGPGQATCLCKITCGNWCIILLLFAIYYTFIGCFFWGLIEALFKVKAQGLPSHIMATDRY